MGNNNDYNAIEKRIFDIINEPVIRNDNVEITDSMMDSAVKCVIEAGTASTSLIQRKLKVGYARAGRLLDEMEQQGVVGPHNGSTPRKVIITYDEWVKRRNNCVSNKESSHNPDTHKKKDDNSLTAELRELLANMPPVEKIYKDNFRIDVDYSDNGYFLNKLDNFVFPQSSDTIQTQFITRMVTYASPNRLKLLLIDDGVSYSMFRGIPSLLIPIVTDNKKADGAFAWLLNEMKSRLAIFADLSCKDINSYNDRMVNGFNNIERMPYIAVIVNESYNLFNNSNNDEVLIPLLLNSKRTGIIFYFFSRFSFRNLSLGIKADLLKVGDSVDLEHIFNKTFDEAHIFSIEDIDNNMTGTGFEKFSGELLQKNGFTNISVTKSSGDYGADVIAFKDGIKYAIQCKKYSSPVGISAIQEVIASKTIYNCHVACVLTNNIFTPAAMELANKNLVLLWDRTKLKELMNNIK